MKATVIQNISNQYKVIDEEDNMHICIARGKLKNNNQVLNKREENALKLATNYGKINTLTPVAGDKVEIENEAITKIYERINFIKRPKIANVTQVVFVVSLKEPEPDILMLDKQLAFAENMGLKSIIVLNKCDLADSSNLKNIYEKVGYPVLEMQAKNNIGVDKLKDYLKENITVFSGNSGVGKSTIINSLFGKNITEEGLVSEKNKRGKNTTTAVTLYELEKDAYIADTPGFSTFDINEIDYKNLDKEFIDFIPFIQNCKYVGCSHIYENEKECNVKRAVLDGKISKSRYENFVKIYKELEENYKRRYN